MAVFRIERTKDYTVMSNHHLKNAQLTLKAKGLLSMMLSLPDDWNYTTRGLAAICKEGVDAIGTALKELEQAGYITRRRLRGKDGKIYDTEYTIYELPQKARPPDTEQPHTENPDMVKPCTGKPAQLNTKKSNTKESKTYLSNTHSFLPVDGLTDGLDEREKIKAQIEYEILSQQYSVSQLDELVELILEVELNKSETIRMGRDAEYPASFVRERFSQLRYDHIEKVMDGIKENTSLVRNTKAYLLTALFNSVATIDNHYTMLVNHDMHSE